MRFYNSLENMLIVQFKMIILVGRLCLLGQKLPFSRRSTKSFDPCGSESSNPWIPESLGVGSIDLSQLHFGKLQQGWSHGAGSTLHISPNWHLILFRISCSFCFSISLFIRGTFCLYSKLRMR